MRYLKSVLIGITMCSMAVFLSGLAFAEMENCAMKGGKGKGASADKIKTLRDSALALQATNPDLAKGLNDLADKKAEDMKKWQEWKDKHDAKMKLLKDSSMALKASNPALAKELEKMSEARYMNKEAMGKDEAKVKMGCMQE